MKTNHLVGPVVSHKSRSNDRVQNILQVSSYYAVHIMSTFLLYGRYHFSSLCSVCSALILISQSKSRMRLGVEVPTQRLYRDNDDVVKRIFSVESCLILEELWR